MKLQGCDCGGMAQVTYKISEHSDFVVECTVCGNSTPAFEGLIEAVSLWNRIYCCALPAYENEPA